MSEHEFAPFGMEVNPLWQESVGGFDREDPKRFTAHERDYASDGQLQTSKYLDYMHARYYSPGVGRFLSVDPLLDQKFAVVTPQGWNQYAYVRNNPLRFGDPTGKYTCEGNARECGVFVAGIVRLKIAAFEAARNGTAGATRLREIMNFYGDFGQKNGVNVVFGRTTSGAPFETVATSSLIFGHQTQITIDRPQFDKTQTLFNAASAAHEGDHGIMFKMYPNLDINSRRDLMLLETNGYRAYAYVYRAFGVSEPHAGFVNWDLSFNGQAIARVTRGTVDAECASHESGCTP
jgi:RHS repeat-associated protein